MIRRLFVTLAVTALLGEPLVAQDAPQALDTIFRDFASDAAPGCAVGVTRGTTPLATRAYGMADLEHGVPLTPQSVFYMASVSKQFMALSILLLERDGALHLDDRVRTYIPELPEYAAAITIRQLLHHTSGLRDYLTLAQLAGHPSDHVITERDVLGALARQTRLNFAPGTEYLYSNSGYVLLAIIAHRVSGRPLDAFAQERIFAPLGMRSTRFQHDHAAPIPGRAIGYVRGNGSWRIANSLLDVVGDGGMYSSVDDMLRWATAFERPEFAPLLARMQTPGTLADGRPIANGYGMGLSAGTYRGVQTVAHGGALAGYRTQLLRLPAEQVTIVTLCNTATANASRLSSSVAELHAPAGMTPAASAGATTSAADPTSAPPRAQAPSAVPRELADAMAGAYYSAELDATYRFASDSGGATLEIGTVAPFPLNVIGPDRLRGRSAALEITLVRDGGGRVTGFTLDAGRVRGLSFVRR